MDPALQRRGPRQPQNRRRSCLGGCVDGWTDRWMERCWVDARWAGWVDRRDDGSTGGWVDGVVGRCAEHRTAARRSQPLQGTLTSGGLWPALPPAWLGGSLPPGPSRRRDLSVCPGPASQRLRLRRRRVLRSRGPACAFAEGVGAAGLGPGPVAGEAVLSIPAAGVPRHEVHGLWTRVWTAGVASVGASALPALRLSAPSSLRLAWS